MSILLCSYAVAVAELYFGLNFKFETFHRNCEKLPGLKASNFFMGITELIKIMFCWSNEKIPSHHLSKPTVAIVNFNETSFDELKIKDLK